MQRTAVPAALLLAITLATPALAGPLSPPAGAITASGKTLAEVEPRTAVNATNTPGNATSLYRITQPGSYYLTGNIAGEPGKHGIEIAAINVTLDLNGFTMTGVSGSLSGVYFNSSGGEVRNGSIRLWGGNGVGFQAGLPRNRVIDVRAAGNEGVGIAVGAYSEVRNCNSQSNGSHGIMIYSIGRAEGCSSVGNGGDGIKAPNSGNIIINCTAGGNTGNGINVDNNNTVIGCNALNNDLNGIEAENSVVRDCVVSASGQYGFYLGQGASASGNRASNSASGGFYISGSCALDNNHALNNGAGVAGRAGFTITGVGNRVTDNHATGNPVGFYVPTGPSVLTGNTAMANTATGFVVNSNTNTLMTGNAAVGNPANFTIGAGNDNAAAVTNPGANFTTTNPAANYAN